MWKLVHFTADEGSSEYVAILDEGEDPNEYCPDGFSVEEILDIDGDATTFPTSRLLKA